MADKLSNDSFHCRAQTDKADTELATQDILFIQTTGTSRIDTRIKNSASTVTTSTVTLQDTQAMTTGSVPFYTSTGELGQDNANLFFDDSGNQLQANSVRAGDATNNVTIDANGITLNGTAKPTRCVQVFPYTFAPDQATLSSVSEFPAIVYGDVGKERSNFSLYVPLDMDTSVDPVIRVHLCPVDAQSSGSDFFLGGNFKYRKSGDTLSATFDQFVSNTVTVSNTATTLTTLDFTLTAASISDTDIIASEFFRDPTDIGDDRNGDMAVVLIEFRYTADK